VAFSRSIAEAVLIDGEPIVTVNARDASASELTSLGIAKPSPTPLPAAIVSRNGRCSSTSRA